MLRPPLNLTPASSSCSWSPSSPWLWAASGAGPLRSQWDTTHRSEVTGYKETVLKCVCVCVCREKQSVTVLSAGEERSDSGDLTLYSPLKVLLFVVLMCVMLVLMYYFYRYLGESLLPTLWLVRISAASRKCVLWLIVVNVCFCLVMADGLFISRKLET